MSYKRILVYNLYDRASRICTPDTIDQERETLRNTLLSNGFPPKFIDKHSAPRPPEKTVFGPDKKQVFLFLPFCGDTFSARIRDRIRSATALAYPAAALRLVCGTRRVPIRSLKDRSPPLSASNLIYEFKCSCGSRYLGRTERRLLVRIGEHLPKWLMMGRLTGPRSS